MELIAEWARVLEEVPSYDEWLQPTSQDPFSHQTDSEEKSTFFEESKVEFH